MGLKPIYEISNLGKQPTNPPLDLLEMRRQIVLLRSRHSDNLRVAHLLNKLFIKLAVLSEPESPAHAQRLRETFSKTMKVIEASIAHHSTGMIGKSEG